MDDTALLSIGGCLQLSEQGDQQVGSAQGWEVLWGPSTGPACSQPPCSNCLLLTKRRCLDGLQAQPWPG